MRTFHRGDRLPRLDRPSLTLYTVGHSNRPLDEFLALVEAHGVRGIADVRAFPSSRRWPHFNRAALSAALQARGIDYAWLPALGGRRHGEPHRGQPHRDSPHTAWTVAGFRNYADHMDTEEFAQGLEQLLAAAQQRPTAFMCAEALYWRCHRRLIADTLVVLGHRVLHIQTADRAVEHRLPDFARVVDGRLIYNGGTQLEIL
jgi:uncharacterized protein (DUF488 family)